MFRNATATLSSQTRLFRRSAAVLALGGACALAGQAQSYIPPIVASAQVSLLSGMSGANPGQISADKAGNVYYIDHSTASTSLKMLPAPAATGGTSTAVVLVTGLGQYNSDGTFVDSKGNLWVANGNGSATVSGSTDYIGLLEIPAGANGLPNVSGLSSTAVASLPGGACTAAPTAACYWSDNAFASSVTNYYSQPSTVIVTTAGIVIFADYNGKNVVSFNPASNPNTGTLLAPEPATSTGGNNQASMAVDGAGNVYYCDDASTNYGAGGSGKVSLISGGSMTTVGTTATNGAAVITSCIGIANDQFGNLFITGTGAGSGNPQQASEVPFEGAALNFSDEFVITNSTANGSATGLTAAPAYPPTTDQYGNLYYATASSLNQLQINGYNFGTVPVGTLETGSTTPAAPAINLYVTTAPNGSISSYFPTGSPTTNATAAYLQSFPYSGTKSFAGGSSYTSGSNYSIVMDFQPIHPGLLKGSFTPRTSGADDTVVNLMGIGSGPEALFFPGTPSTLFTKTTATSPVALNAPQGIAVDSYGDVFVADTGNGKVVADCLATTVQNEDGTGGNTSNSFCSESGNNSQPTYTGTIQDVGGSFVSPSALAVDGAQSVYVVDSGSGAAPLSVITGQSTATSAVTIIASGTKVGGTALSGPKGVAVDGFANIYVADTGNNRIIEAHQFGAQPVSGTLATDNIVYIPSTTTFGGTALSAPQGLAIDGAGDLFIADTGNNRVVEYSAAGVASVISSGSITLSAPYAVAVYPSGQLVVSDNGNGVVLLAGSSSQVLSLGTTLTAKGSQGVALGPLGNIFVSVTASNAVAEINVASPTVNFPNTNDGSISSTISTTVANEGNASLALSALASSNSNFTIDNSSTCSSTSTLSVGATCALVTKFSPQSVGALTGGVTLTDNELGYTLNTGTSNETGTFATSGTQTVNLTGQATSAGAPQTITFPALTTPITYNTTPIPLSATASSGLAVTFSVLSGPGQITGTASAPTLTVTGVGTIVVAADQPGNNSYQAAPEVTQSIVVNQASQTITFAPTSPITYGGSANSIDLTKAPNAATASSGLPITYTLVSGPATLSGTNLTINNYGTVVITASQPGNSDYSAATSVTAQIVVNPTGTLTAPVQTDQFGYTTGGTYNTLHSPTVTLSDATTGTTIYYTVDGSTPTTSSTQYKGAFAVSATETVKAIAVENGYVSSSVSAVTYTVVSSAETLAFTLSASSLSLGLGQSGTVTVTVTPGNGIIGPISFACTGAPAGGSCTFSPTTANATPSQTTLTSTMTVTAPTTLAMLEEHGRSMLPETTLALCICLFGWRKRRNLRIALMLMIAAAGMTWLSGCGGGTTTQNWPLTVVVSGDNVRNSGTVALTIHQ